MPQGALLNTSPKFAHTPPAGRASRLYEVNERAVHGMVNIGKGAKDLFTVAAHLDIPLASSFLNGEAWKRHELCIGKVIEEEATSSVQLALDEEIEMEKNANPHFYKITRYNGRDLIHVPASGDEGWHKRSSERTYDSNGGVMSIFGGDCGKIISWKVGVRYYEQCASARRRGDTPSDESKRWALLALALEEAENHCFCVQLTSRWPSMGLGILVKSKCPGQ